MLLERITGDRAKYRKDAATSIEYNLLTCIYSDLSLEQKQRGGEELSDDDVIRVLNRYKKTTEENLQVVSDGMQRSELQRELKALLAYLPQQLHADEIKKIIADAIAGGMDNIGALMGHLKAEYNGRYNPREASALAKELLG